MKRVVLVWMLAMSLVCVASAETRLLKSGPPAKVEKSVDKHLFQIYVTPPKATKQYSPGEITICLKREYPDYMYVPLKHAQGKDGRLHVQIAISPEKESTYTINVIDLQPDGETLLLFSKELKNIENSKP